MQPGRRLVVASSRRGSTNPAATEVFLRKHRPTHRELRGLRAPQLRDGKGRHRGG
jgi:hypothetical protein